jgi:FixJ family two-component response regulator
MDPTQVTVYLIDDEPDVTRALAWLLESISVPSRSFSSAKDFFDQFDFSAGPACLVLDLRMPEVGGLEVMKMLTEQKFNLPVIFLSAHGNIPTAVQAMQLGAINFLQKPFNAQEFLDAVNKAMCVARKNFERHQSKLNTEKLLQRLSSREREVLGFLLNGATSKQIARDLSISYKTVDVHRANILRKLEVTSYFDLKRKFSSSIHIAL